MDLLKYSSFINERNDQKSFWLGVNTLDEASKLYKIISDSGYVFSGDFNEDLIRYYFDMYDFGYESSKIFVYSVYTDKYETSFRGINKDTFDILKMNKKAYLYPDDENEIKRILGLRPSYEPRMFVYENKIYPYEYIVVKINNNRELEELKNMLKETVGTNGNIHNGYGLPNYLFIPSDIKLNPTQTCPWLDTDTPTHDMIDEYITNANDTDGTYLTVSDLKKIKLLITVGTTSPSYKPKKFVYEDNKLREVDSFNNFMINEKLDGSVPFVISQRLEDLLKKIRHPIARKLIDMSADDQGYSNEATLLDLDEFIFDHFVYTTANKYKDAIRSETDVIDPNADKSKVYDFIKTNPGIYNEYPSTIRIGRLINKLFPGEFSPSGVKNSIESFVDAVVTQRNKKFNKIEIVNGEDIVKYYNEDNYHKDAFNGSELGNSCMRYGSCSDYIQFYADNPDVQLVILKKGKGDKIVARALLWKIQYGLGKEKREGYFLDRIYFAKRYQKNLFVEYAKKNEWFYKKQQNSLKDTEIFDPTLNFYTKLDLKTVPTFKKSSTGEYPYMDTMKWFYVDRGFLSNSLKFKEGDETVYFLEDTDGRYTTEENGVYISHYDDYINEDDLVYCEYGDDMRLTDDAIYLPDEDAFATEEYAEENCIFDENGYCILKEKSVPYVDVNGKTKYTSKKYALDNFFYSDIDHKFHELADYSDFYETYIPSDKAVKVYLTSDIQKILKNHNVKTDYYIKGDNEYITYKPKNRRNRKPMYFSNDVADDFVLVTTDLNLDDKEYYHKKYDRDKYGILNGEYVTKEILEKEKGK